MSSRAVSGTLILVLPALAAVAVLVTALFVLRRRAAAGKFRLQTILDQLSEGVAILNGDGAVVQVNRAAGELLGLRAGETLDHRSKPFRMLWPDGEEVPAEEWPSVLATRKRFVTRADYRIVSQRTGVDLRAEVSTSPLTEPPGDSAAALMIIRDNTQTRQALEVQNRLAAIVESSEDAIIGKGIDGIVTSWNRSAETVYGFSAAEMIGQSVIKLLPDDRLGEEDEILAEVGRGRKIVPFETVRRRKDGKLIQVSLAVSPIRGAGGTVIGASQIAHDITDQKQMQLHLRQSQKMEAIGQLTGGVAHDFNNILGIVIGSLDLLERQLEGNVAALARVRTAQKASARGADLARRLLAASSGGALHPARVDLVTSIHNMVELSVRALGPEFHLELKLEPGISPVYMDAAGFEVAMLNVLVNARDAMPRGGTITVAAQTSTVPGAGEGKGGGSELKPGRYVCVSVTDRGEGMSREVMERAMEPFFTTKEVGKGTGLGLAMVYGFFRQSGGTVHLYSEQGYGTTVSMYLPLSAGEAREPDQPQRAEVEPRGTGTVLVVDDEADLLEIATAHLREAGYEALTAEDMASAMTVLRAHPEVAILVTDVLMPGGKNGFDLAQAARRLRPGLRVVYCSGFPVDSFAERKIVLDGPFLRKPYRADHLVAIVRETLAEPAASQPSRISSRILHEIE